MSTSDGKPEAVPHTGVRYFMSCPRSFFASNFQLRVVNVNNIRSTMCDCAWQNSAASREVIGRRRLLNSDLCRRRKHLWRTGERAHTHAHNEYRPFLTRYVFPVRGNASQQNQNEIHLQLTNQFHSVFAQKSVGKIFNFNWVALRLCIFVLYKISSGKV